MISYFSYASFYVLVGFKAIQYILLAAILTVNVYMASYVLTSLKDHKSTAQFIIYLIDDGFSDLVMPVDTENTVEEYQQLSRFLPFF